MSLRAAQAADQRPEFASVLDSFPRSPSLTQHACRAALHNSFDLTCGRHGGVAGGRHCESTVCSAAFHGELRSPLGKKSVNQARGEGVAASDAIIDFKVGTAPRLIKLTIHIADCAPIVTTGGRGLAQCRRYYLEGKLFDDLSDHRLETFRFEVPDILVDTLDFKAKRGGKVFLVAEHDVDEWSDCTVNLLRLGLPSNCLP